MSRPEQNARLYHYAANAAPIVYMVWVGAALTTFTCTLVAISAIWIQLDRIGFQPQATLLAFGSLILGWIVLFFFWGLYPVVALEPDAVVLRCPFCRIRLVWSDIDEVIMPRRPGHGSPAVTARKITPFHLIYGAIYARRLRPAFLLGWPLERREEAVQEIERRLANRKD